MEHTEAGVDFRQWDWLPDAASEVEAYVQRLLAEAAIKAHNVSARAKSITSFQEKCNRKDYRDPRRDVTDTVAVRIITYSVTDRDRTAQLIRDRFSCSEDVNPGATKGERRRGYDCHHFIVTGEASPSDVGWLIAGGKLVRYFESFGGLEVQIRTVAAHAWAEFEHSRRYKGQSYDVISDHDRQTIDQLFGAAADARRALDETFVAIDRVLANPTSPPGTHLPDTDTDTDTDTLQDAADETAPEDAETPVDPSSLRDYLALRFPDDSEATERGMQFACALVNACGIRSIERLTRLLDRIDSDQVRRLMDTSTAVTRVRRLDDELLARLGEQYIAQTDDVGDVHNRHQQLQWRFDRLRDKVSVLPYKTYELAGFDCPDELRGQRFPAARAVREVARVIANSSGIDAAIIADRVAESEDALAPSTRPRRVRLDDGRTLWVASNLRRDASEALLVELLHHTAGIDLRVIKNGDEIAAH